MRRKYKMLERMDIESLAPHMHAFALIVGKVGLRHVTAILPDYDTSYK